MNAFDFTDCIIPHFERKYKHFIEFSKNFRSYAFLGLGMLDFSYIGVYNAIRKE